MVQINLPATASSGDDYLNKLRKIVADSGFGAVDQSIIVNKANELWNKAAGAGASLSEAITSTNLGLGDFALPSIDLPGLPDLGLPDVGGAVKTFTTTIEFLMDNWWKIIILITVMIIVIIIMYWAFILSPILDTVMIAAVAML